MIATRRLASPQVLDVHVAILMAVLSASPLTTVSEASGFKKTGRYDEVVRLCKAFERTYTGKVRCDTFGTTPEGRPMVALVASADRTLDPTTARKRNRPVVLFQGGIHAGEIDGKDAGFWFLRDVLDGKLLPGVLSKVTALFVPVLNVDGHERFGPNHRVNQVGPEEMGWRVTAQNLNLNRDYAKAETPEMVAMLKLLGQWDPILYLDLHVTDGAKFQHDVAVMIEPLLVGPDSMRALGKATRDALFLDLTARGHLPLGFYPSFIKEDEPPSGFSVGVAPPRFSQGYWSLKNRFAALVEVHSWKDYPTRVNITRNVLIGFFAQAAADGAKWLDAARKADSEDASKIAAETILRYENTDRATTLDFRGYAYTREPSPISGKNWIRYDDSKPEIWKLPFYEELRPVLTVRTPKAGYVIPKAHADLMANKLRIHGLEFRVISKTVPASNLETFRADLVQFQPRPFEGRQVVTVKGEWKAETREIPAGSLFVPVLQRGQRLVMQLLEPAARDSFLSWGFFNVAFEEREYMEAYVAEAVAREMMAKDPKVKEAFDKRIATDPAFAKDPEARLKFFHQRHPSWDERVNLYPIYRVDTLPE